MWYSGSYLDMVISEETCRTELTVTVIIFTWDSPASALLPPWAWDASRLPLMLVSALPTQSYLPCHWLPSFFPSPWLYPVMWGWLPTSLYQVIFLLSHCPKANGVSHSHTVNRSTSFLLNSTRITSPSRYVHPLPRFVTHAAVSSSLAPLTSSDPSCTFPGHTPNRDASAS